MTQNSNKKLENDCFKYLGSKHSSNIKNFIT